MNKHTIKKKNNLYSETYTFKKQKTKIYQTKNKI